jgi:hypothetical protein
MSKWFCDTFTGAATGAVRWGSFFEGVVVFGRWLWMNAVDTKIYILRTVGT